MTLKPVRTDRTTGAPRSVAALLGLVCLAGHDLAAAGAAAVCLPYPSSMPHDNRVSASTTATPTAAMAPPPFSIAVWGDSLTATRDFIDAALATQGVARETVLPSFIPAALNVAGLQLPVKAACASEGWQIAYAHKEKPAPAAFSKGLLSMRSHTPGDTLAFDFRAPLASTRVRRLTMFYEKEQADSSLLLGIAVDNGDETLISLSGRAGRALYLQPAVPMATVRVRLVAGALTVHGFAPHYAVAPRLIVDALSVPGGRLRGWSNVAAAPLPGPDGAFDYRVILVQYGTNEGAASDFSPDAYRAYLRTHLGRLRALYPRARCILIGPPDRGVVGSAGAAAALHYSTVHGQIASAQAQAARAQHCQFWDWQAAMGGAGSAARWAALQPPWMQQT